MTNFNGSVSPLGYEGINIEQQPIFIGNQYRAPNGGDLYPAGTVWDYVSGTVHTFYISSGGSTVGNVTSGVWTAFSSSLGEVVAVNGTTNQVTVVTTSGTATVSLPSAITTPGSLTTTTTLTGGTGITATTGNITATNGNLNLNGAGNKLNIHASTAASDSVGTSAALDGASPSQQVVSTTAVTAASKIFLTYNTAGGTLGSLSIGTIVPGTSFQILSSANGDTSTVNYWIIN